MTVPRHPASERRAAYFHGFFAGVGLVHIIGGLLMIWFHGTGARRHWAERKALD